MSNAYRIVWTLSRHLHLPRGETDPTVTGQLRALDTTDLERRLADASRSWRDDFLAAVLSEYGEQVGATLGRRYVDSFPEAYKEDFLPRAAAVDPHNPPWAMTHAVVRDSCQQLQWERAQDADGLTFAERDFRVGLEHELRLEPTAAATRCVWRASS